MNRSLPFSNNDGSNAASRGESNEGTNNNYVAGGDAGLTSQSQLQQDFLQQQQQQLQQQLQIQQLQQQDELSAQQQQLMALSGMQGGMGGLNNGNNFGLVDLSGSNPSGAMAGLTGSTVSFDNWGGTSAGGGMPGLAPTSQPGDMSVSERMLLAQRMQAGANASFLGGANSNPTAGMPATSSGGELSLLQRMQQQQQHHSAGGGLGMGAANASFNNLMGGGVNAGDLSASDRMLLAQSAMQQQQQPMGMANAAFLGMGGSGVASAAQPQQDPYAAQGILGPWSERAAGLLGSMVCANPSGATAKGKRPRRKQPKDKPKRPLSAYNIFFKEERQRLLEKGGGKEKRTANGKIGFESLAKIIGGKWQDLQPNEVEYYKGKAGEDMKRYKKEMEVYKAKEKAKEKGAKYVESGDGGDASTDGDHDDEDLADEEGKSNFAGGARGKRRRTSDG